MIAMKDSCRENRIIQPAIPVDRDRGGRFFVKCQKSSLNTGISGLLRVRWLLFAARRTETG